MQTLWNRESGIPVRYSNKVVFQLGTLIKVVFQLGTLIKVVSQLVTLMIVVSQLDTRIKWYFS